MPTVISQFTGNARAASPSTIPGIPALAQITAKFIRGFQVELYSTTNVTKLAVLDANPQIVDNGTTYVEMVSRVLSSEISGISVNDQMRIVCDNAVLRMTVFNLTKGTSVGGSMWFFDPRRQSIADATVPSVSITSPMNGQNITSSSFTVLGTAGDASGINKVEVWVGNGPSYLLATGKTSWSRAVTFTASGTYLIVAKATDGAGNTNTAQITVTVTLGAGDTTPPLVSISQPGQGHIIATKTPIIRGTASDNVALSKVEVSIDGGLYVPASGTTSWNYTPTTALSEGSHTVSARAVDTSGNPSAPQSVTFIVDTVKPLISIITPVNGQTFSGGPSVNIVVSGTASDETSGVKLVEISVDGGPFSPATGLESWSKTITISTSGQHEITARATDGAVNTALMTMSLPAFPEEQDMPEVSI